MDVILSAETRKLIDQRLHRGGYATADDVVLAGLASLEQQEAIGEFDAGELDQMLAEGERGGEALDGEHVLAEMAKLRERSVRDAT